MQLAEQQSENQTRAVCSGTRTMHGASLSHPAMVAGDTLLLRLLWDMWKAQPRQTLGWAVFHCAK
jgi:hypothetical protein